MATEGTYPHAFGGVSVWCDQIVRGLPQHDFAVHAITVTGTEPVSWEPPPNVTVHPIALWPAVTAAGRQRTPEGPARRAVGDAYRDLFRCLPTPPVDALAPFTDALRRLCAAGQDPDRPPPPPEEHAVGWLLEAWRAAPIAAQTGLELTVLDAVTCVDILSHWLRPLLRPAPEAALTHAVTNGLAALVALGAKWTHGTPIVLTEHGVYLRERYLGLRTMPYSWPVRAMLLAFQRLLCTAAYQAADLITPGNRYNHRWETRFGADPARIRTVYNGVNPADFPPAGEEPAAPTVTWAGRIDPIKDLETLLRSFALIHAELPETRLRIFGGTPAGNQGYHERCVALAAELGVTEAVGFEGRVTNIRDAYAAGHVVVLSSISEGFPYTLIEAMTSGRATVSTDVGGVSEAVADTGLVVAPRDPPAMSEACLRLLRDAPLRRRFGAAARDRALELFTVDQAVDAFAAIYASLTPAQRVSARAAVPRQRVGAADVETLPDMGAVAADPSQPVTGPAPAPAPVSAPAPAPAPVSAQPVTGPEPALPRPVTGRATVPRPHTTGRVTGRATVPRQRAGPRTIEHVVVIPGHHEPAGTGSRG